jgi:uncharacterized FlaG/YvyC family protein
MGISPINHAASQASAVAETPTKPPVNSPANSEQRTLIQAVKTVNESGALGADTEMTFFLDRTTKIPVVRILNSKTGAVIDQIPAEYVLRIAEELKGS